MRIQKTLFLMFMLLFSGVAGVLAQDAAVPVTEVKSPNNLLAILLVVIAIVFALVIFAMGQVLLQLIKQVMQYRGAAKNTLVLVIASGLMFLSNGAAAQNAAAEASVKTIPNYGGLDATAFWIFVFVIGIEILAILFLLVFIRRMQAELVPPSVKPQSSSSLAAWWSKIDKRFFTKAVPVEKEADVLLDHEYDGIRELDNSLPPWWKWGFIFTCIFAVVYLVNFHVLGYGKNPTEEYAAENKAAEQKMEAYNAKNKNRIDESNIVMADAAGIAEAKSIYSTTCIACHGAAGEGGVGPNLTDDYWLHKGSLTDIYHSIKVGYPDKGMQSWEKQYSPKQMSELASYIKTLHGTNPPNAKAPQGDLFTDGTASSAPAATPATDSAAKK